MTLRLVEIVVPEPSRGAIEAALEDQPTLAHWEAPLEGDKVRLSVLLGGGATEETIQAIEERVSSITDARVILMEVQATIPRPEEIAEEEDAKAEQEEAQQAGPPSPSPGPEPVPRRPEPEGGDAEPEEAEEEDESKLRDTLGIARLSTAELHQDVQEMTALTPIHIGLVFLSTVVAAFGLLRGDIAVIIGAMVIAPLLGPNVALSLATTLADLELARKSITTAIAGLSVAILASILMGWAIPVDPTVAEIANRTVVGWEQITLALAAGGAAVLSLSVGVSTALVGVMVAVALLPPLAAAGLLAGAGYPDLAFGAAALAGINLICINLAGVVTFLVQGVRPMQYWEAEKAREYTASAIVVWTLLLAALTLLLWYSGLIEGLPGGFDLGP